MILEQLIRISDQEPTNPQEVYIQNTKMALLEKLSFLRNFNSEICGEYKPQEYVEECLKILRLDEEPKIYFCNLGNFEILKIKISEWLVINNKMAKIVTRDIILSGEAILENFFWENGLILPQSKYYSSLSPELRTMRKIETIANEASVNPNQNLSFDSELEMKQLPSAADPFGSPTIDKSSNEQILVGDALYMPYLLSDGRVAIKGGKITY